MILDDILSILKTKSENKSYMIDDFSYSYAEFYKFVCNIYYFLLRRNKEKKPIVVYGHKDVYMKATFVACSFAGITYVPVDESIPKERVLNIINQVAPFCVIGDFECDSCENISANDICQIMHKQDFLDIEKIYLKPDDIYYIMFTSGSTGVPKGVKVTYRNLDSCINWLNKELCFDKEVILNQANFSFDLSIADLYLSLTNESEHFILNNTTNFDFNHIFNQLQQSKATLAVMTPSFADLLLVDKNFNDELMPSLRTIIFCGEKLLKETVKKLYSRFRNIKIINSYGPTECTFAVTSIEIDKNSVEENLSIGKPKDDVKIVILGEDKEELEEGKRGEILIVGESVAAGYLGDESSDKFFKYKGENAYLTGDLGYLKDEKLYYVDRKDNQIKYNGYRIELSDIENNLYKLNYFEKVKVIDKKNKEGKVDKIIAFVKLKSDIIKTPLEIKKELELKIPKYMCPVIKILEKFPITNNGKTDISELRRRVCER